MLKFSGILPLDWLCGLEKCHYYYYYYYHNYYYYYLLTTITHPARTFLEEITL